MHSKNSNFLTMTIDILCLSLESQLLVTERRKIVHEHASIAIPSLAEEEKLCIHQALYGKLCSDRQMSLSFLQKFFLDEISRR